MSSGTAIDAVVAADGLLDHVAKLRAFLAETPDYLSGKISERGISPPACLDVHFALFEDGGYGVIETHTHMRFRLSA